jgi:hypothetical protein
VLLDEQVYQGAADLQFDNLPKNSLYWLKAKNGRGEERIFTIDEYEYLIF